MRRLSGLTLLLFSTLSLLFSQPRPYWHTVHYANWEHSDVPPRDIPWQSITHLIHFAGKTLGSQTNSNYPYWQAPSNWEVEGTFHIGDTLRSYGRRFGVAILIDLGFNSDNSFSNLCAKGDTALQTWAGTVGNYIFSKGYDGGDFDAEGGSYPLNGGMGRMAQLLHDTLAALNPGKKYYITTSCMPNAGDLGGFGIKAYQQYFDQVNPMFYDVSGTFGSPLYKNPNCSAWGSDSGVAFAYLNAGIDRSRIGLGYNIQVYHTSSTTACPPGGFGYISKLMNEIRYFVGGTIYWDDVTKESYMINSVAGVKIAYEDTISTWYKADFIKRNGFGGAMGFCLGRGHLPVPPLGINKDMAVYGMGRALNGDAPPPVPYDPLPRIAGRSFLDLDSDGSPEAGEPGLPLWKIYLLRTSPDTTLDSALTGATGRFSFDALPRGTYQLSANSVPSSGDSVLSWTRTLPSNSFPYSVIIDADTASIVRDFGNYSPGMRVMWAYKNWNLLSLPYSVTDARPTAVFPLASSYTWQYTDHFMRAANVTTGPGYWVRFPAASTWAVAGGRIDQVTIPVTDGWNLIGSVAQPVSTDALLAANPYLVSKFFGYRGGGGFMADDTIEPGKGYWIKASGGGQMLLSQAIPQGLKLTSSLLDLRQLNSITFTSNSGDAQTLYFAADSSQSSKTLSYLMPPPMDGMFDARFSAGSSSSSGTLVNIVDPDHLQSIDLPIILKTAEYPLTLRWEIRTASAQAELLVGGGRSIRLEGTGQGPIQSDPAGADPAAGRRVTLRLNAISKSTLPAAFELFQNFPNPFNPATSIRFSLADDSFVQLDVLNLLGQKVSAVLRRQMGAGSHSISFDASRLPSGVYFYKLHARASAGKEFTQVKRMVLLR
ncbi:MAG TPA: glycosyl hydrolase family 18 protein [Bacteroidota bacterium]|nr:glycosyl hydrolase family 18 protein [Bacteroidota bacterium]